MGTAAAHQVAQLLFWSQAKKQTMFKF